MATPSSRSFPMRLPPLSSSSLATSKNFKTLIRNIIFSHLCRTYTKVKSIIINLFKETDLNNIRFLKRNKNKNKTKVLFGSFRLHYNWCSSHVVPVTSLRIQDTFNNDHDYYYDSTWDSYLDHEMVLESRLTGYLQWLEEKNNGGVDKVNEIDRLADKFIANSHEKFMLEKQESYRRFQEMMARSV